MRAFLGDFEEVIFCECFGQGLFVEPMADIKAALAHARLVAKTAGNAGNTGNTGNTENNSSDIKPFGAIELAAINQVGNTGNTSRRWLVAKVTTCKKWQHRIGNRKDTCKTTA
jgi:hypothetical protein